MQSPRLTNYPIRPWRKALQHSSMPSDPYLLSGDRAGQVPSSRYLLRSSDFGKRASRADRAESLQVIEVTGRADYSATEPKPIWYSAARPLASAITHQ